MKLYSVYIMTNRRNGTLYIGVTSDLPKRVYEHKNGLIEGFTKKYGLHLLVYYECTEGVHEALQREKNLKHYVRKWKLDLINKFNPQWRDLSEDIGLVLDSRAKPENDSILMVEKA